MAIIYETTLTPSKLELLTEWLPKQPWFVGDAASIEEVGAYRFDDPEGEVGMEGHLLRVEDGRVYHVPLTYRGAPLEGGAEYLVGTSEHGVLGTRWFYDATGDPVFQAVIARAIALGEHEADETIVEEDGHEYPEETTTKVRGSGEPGASIPNSSGAVVTQGGEEATASNEAVTLGIRRVLTQSFVEPEGTMTLRATWPEQIFPVVVATLAVS